MTNKSPFNLSDQLSDEIYAVIDKYHDQGLDIKHVNYVILNIAFGIARQWRGPVVKTFTITDDDGEDFIEKEQKANNQPQKQPGKRK